MDAEPKTQDCNESATRRSVQRIVTPRQTVIRSLRSMNGEIRCPDCNGAMQRCGVDGYKCRKCGEGWNVNPI